MPLDPPRPVEVQAAMRKIPPTITGGKVVVACLTCERAVECHRTSDIARTRECNDCFWERMGDDY